MTKDEVIRMADEADLWADQELQCIGEYHPDWHEVRDVRFAALVAEEVRGQTIESEKRGWLHAIDKMVAAEREACAKVCDEVGNRDRDSHAWDAAAAIRARGQA